LFKVFEAYKKWLFTLKILDPASCGSGAFLNQALNFLIAEHQEIDNLIADLTNAMPKFYDTDKMILEKIFMLCILISKVLILINFSYGYVLPKKAGNFLI